MCVELSMSGVLISWAWRVQCVLFAVCAIRLLVIQAQREGLAMQAVTCRGVLPM